MALSVRSKVLARGVPMPLYGLGTWLSKDDSAINALHASLDAGVMLVDTAQMYENESAIGRALAARPRRERHFVVSKLAPTAAAHADDAVAAAARASLARLGVARLDLFLVHSPRPGNVVSVWRQMLGVRDAGLARLVGVSNFGEEHLRALAAAGLEAPAVNQIELHVFNQKASLLAYCRAANIVVMGFCPLARMRRADDATLASIGRKHAVSVPLVMLRWSVQSGVVTIPKSSSPSRVVENTRVFDFALDDDDMRRIRELDDGFEASTATTAERLPVREVM